MPACALGLTLLAAALLAAATGCGGSQSVQAAASVNSLQPSVLSAFKLTGSVDPVRDPSIIRQGNTYYVFSTDDGAPLNGSIAIRCSTDLTAWSDCGHVFNAIPAWIARDIPGVIGLWAPDISYFNHEYHLYYAASIFGTNRSLIGLATNTTLDPADPNYAWVDQGEVLISTPHDDFNAIDPNIVIESNGAVWLTYGSFSTGVKQAPVDPLTGMLQGPDPEPYSLAARPTSDPHSIEAPFVIRHGNYYYLFVSFGLCCAANPLQSTYRIMFGRGTSVHGPFLDMGGTPMLQGGGTQLLAGNASGWNAPGGQSVFTDPDTGSSTIVFHAHRLPAGTPYLFVNPLTWNNDWPQITP
jgi:arabinan endo-1,5-alpha-L-arabinosidase